jgi:hypothetical protein
VDEGASLILTASGWLPNNIPITVYGKLSAGSAIIGEIPPNVDLSRGTLTAADTSTPTFTFGPRAVSIARIELPTTSGSITINGTLDTGGVRQPVSLYVGAIATPAAASLHLPAGTTTVDKIITGATLTLGSSANGHEGDPDAAFKTLFRPSIIAGTADVVLERGGRLELNGAIDLSNTLVLDMDNLGDDWRGQLALITGGSVSTRGDHLVFTGGEILNSQLVNTGEVDISGTVTFNRSAILNKVIVTAPAEVTGRGTFALGALGNLVVNDDVTFSIKGFGLDPGVSLSRVGTETGIITIADEKSIFLGPETQFTAGTDLTLTEGQYKAAGTVTITSTNGTSTVITVGGTVEVGHGLAISPRGDDANNITLLATTAGTAPVFTAVNGGGTKPVIFGKDGIVIPADTTSGAKFTVSGTANVGEVTVAGTSAITLGTSATSALKGILFLLDGAELTAADAPTNGYTYTADNTEFPTAGDFDKALIPTLSAIKDSGAGTGVEITTKIGTTDAKFTSGTEGTKQ